MLLASWPFGAFTTALVTWGTFNYNASNNWSWRVPSLLQGFIPFGQLIIAVFGSEVHDGLVDKGKIEVARKFFVKYHAHDDENSLLIDFQMAEIAATIESEKLQKFKLEIMVHHSKHATPTFYRRFCP